MYAFIFGSSFVITYMIIHSCRRKCLGYQDIYDDDDDNEITMDYIHQKRPFIHYISKTELMQFFSLADNLFKLKKVLDLQNGIFDKTLKLIQNNDEIRQHYEDTLVNYGSNYFHHTYDVPTVMEIRDTKFKTSLGQLNYIRWLIQHDYFLHIE